MASTQQPLLNSPKKATCACKFIYFAIAISTILSAAFLVPNLTKTTYEYVLSSPSHMCQGALFPEKCQDFVSEVVPTGANSADTNVVLQNLLMKQVHLMKNAIFHATKLRNEHRELGALADCLELLALSNDLVLDSIKAITYRTGESRANARAWLSGMLTNHLTCSDGLKPSSRESMESILEDLIQRASASLAILAAIPAPDIEKSTIQRTWITPDDRRMMRRSANGIVPNLVVAKDGSGNYATVAEAIEAAPNKSKTRFVIHVKKGTYKENVEVGKSKKNLMIIGDGMNSTIITGDRNYVDGSTTFNSATLAAVGEGFILQDICIQNTAGAEKHQAVALRVGADKSVINRCRIDAFQDTLYTHSLRQFYRDSYITGTVDFIFGNAAVVLQKCKLVARKPMKSQKNMVTAQGRTDPNQNTGTSIQDCEIIASDDLEPVKGSFPTYLGRPWKEYSRTVVMESRIGDLINPAGWAEWSGDFALKTLYYGEYMNSGPGAGTGKRVNWTGYHVITEAAEAMKFTVKELIQGGEWLSSSGVEYIEGL